MRLVVPEDKLEWAQRHQDFIAGEVLATSFEVVPADQAAGQGAHKVVEGVTADVSKA